MAYGSDTPPGTARRATINDLCSALGELFRFARSSARKGFKMELNVGRIQKAG
jgi:hypothetical protein